MRVVGGTVSPGVVTASSMTWQRLVDGQTTTDAGLGIGVESTATSPTPYYTLELDASFSEVAAGGYFLLACRSARLASWQPSLSA
jgi:hypothetical protein